VNRLAGRDPAVSAERVKTGRRGPACPVRVRTAAEVSFEGQDHSGVAGGPVFTTPGATGFDIHALAGAGRIPVTARAS
jgi:hypothetical protein